ncbi:E2/UBC family protein [Paraburkholderia strydomiana]
MKSLDQQFTDLQRAYPDATLTAVGSGTYVVRVPSVALPEGWSQPTTRIVFVVPNGYPYAAPDCFWADATLRLANGGLPQNSGLGNIIHGHSEPDTWWFSWHVNNAWNASNCNLLTYMNIILNRLRAVQ